MPFKILVVPGEDLAPVQQVADRDAEQRTKVVDLLVNEQLLHQHQATQNGERVNFDVTDVLASERCEQNHQSVCRRKVIGPVLPRSTKRESKKKPKMCSEEKSSSTKKPLQVMKGSSMCE